MSIQDWNWMDNKGEMEIFVLLKGYEYEGYGSNVEVFKTLEEAQARKQLYIDDEMKDEYNPNISYSYGYDLLKIVKRKIK